MKKVQEAFKSGGKRAAHAVPDKMKPPFRRSEHLTHAEGAAAFDHLIALLPHLEKVAASLKSYSLKMRKCAVACSNMSITSLPFFSASSGEAVRKLNAGRDVVARELNGLGETVGDENWIGIAAMRAQLKGLKKEAKLLNKQAGTVAGLKKKGDATALTEENLLNEACATFADRMQKALEEYEALMSKLSQLFLELNAQRFADAGRSLVEVQHQSE